MTVSPQPRLSIVIPAYNEEAFLPVTLASVARATANLGMESEVVVVDNNSSDRTAEVAEAGGARVVFEPVNQISRARNTGARAASGEFLLFLDADSTPPPALVAAVADALARGILCGGGAVVRTDQPLPPSMQAAVKWWNRAALRWNLAAGCFLFCRRDAFEEVGGFDERVYAGEEIWLSRKLHRWGRPKGLPFRLIADPPVTTSARKGEWFTLRQILLQAAILFLFPLAARWRPLCWLWYRRPATASDNLGAHD